MAQGRTGWFRGLMCWGFGLGGLFCGGGDWFRGLGTCFGVGRADSGLARGSVGIGRDSFGGCRFGGCGWTGWDRRFVGQVLGLGDLCWDMGNWDLGLEWGVCVWVARNWALTGSWVPTTKNRKPVQHHKK